MIYQKKIKDLVEDFKNIDLNIESSNEFLSKIMNEVHSFISLHIRFDENEIREKFIDLIDENIESEKIKNKMKDGFKEIIETFKQKKGGAARDATNYSIPSVNTTVSTPNNILQNVDINEDPTVNPDLLEALEFQIRRARLTDRLEQLEQTAERERRTLAIQREHSLTFMLMVFCILDWQNRLGSSIRLFVCNLNINFDYYDPTMTPDHRLMNTLWVIYVKIILFMFIFFDLCCFISTISELHHFDRRIVGATPANTITFEYDNDYNSHLLALNFISPYDVPYQHNIIDYDAQLDNLIGPNNLISEYFSSSYNEDQSLLILEAYNILPFNEFYRTAINRFQYIINRQNQYRNQMNNYQVNILNTSLSYFRFIAVYLLFYNLLRLRNRNRNQRGGYNLKKKSVKKKSVKKKSVRKKSVKKKSVKKKSVKK